jgi:hypothetical protein
MAYNESEFKFIFCVRDKKLTRSFEVRDEKAPKNHRLPRSAKCPRLRAQTGRSNNAWNSSLGERVAGVVYPIRGRYSGLFKKCI